MLTYPNYKIIADNRKDGSVILKSDFELGDIEKNYGSKFLKVAENNPDNIWLAERKDEIWEKISYGEALRYIKSIARTLLDLGLNQEKGVMILSGNSIKHALLSVASICAGIPVSPISVAYSAMSKDFSKLKHCYDLVQPGLVFAENEQMFETALKFLRLKNSNILLSKTSKKFNGSFSYSNLIKNKFDDSIVDIMKSIKPEATAKYLFTSGSTGMPKAVINTHKMLCTNIHQANHILPKETLDDNKVFVDWLPWNHTMGGNHIFNMVLWFGGTLYIDKGKPVPGLFDETIKNLKEISPTSYVSVPAGLAMLWNHLKTDEDLRNKFFKNLRSIHFGGASLPPEVWFGLRDLAKETYGKEIYLACGWGSTETAPVATTTYFHLDKPGNIGLPIPGVEIKLVPNGKKMELRVKGPNVTPGYFKRPDLTKKAFDEEGFYLIGDAGKFIDEGDYSKGIDFDGRVVENFKLLSGTWVDVGTLRLKVVDTCSPFLQDLVIAGHDKDYLGILAWVNTVACKNFIGNTNDTLIDIIKNKSLIRTISEKILIHNKQNPGSSTRIRKIILLDSPPSLDDNEITDKGYINQSATLHARAQLVEKLYDSEVTEEVIFLN